MTTLREMSAKNTNLFSEENTNKQNAPSKLLRYSFVLYSLQNNIILNRGFQSMYHRPNAYDKEICSVTQRKNLAQQGKKITPPVCLLVMHSATIGSDILVQRNGYLNILNYVIL
jgi:hypothetical protein